MLLEHKANPYLQDKFGLTALMIASRYSNTDSTENTVRMLLEHKANPDLQDKFGWTALEGTGRNIIIAFKKEQMLEKMVETVIENPDMNLPLAGGHVALLKDIVDYCL